MSEPAQDVDVCGTSDVPPGTVRAVDVLGRRLCVGNDGGRLFALDDACLHKGGSLGEGVLREGHVTCPLHWWRYATDDGALAGHPTAALTTYPARDVDGRVVVTAAPAPPRLGWSELLTRHAVDGPPGPHAVRSAGWPPAGPTPGDREAALRAGREPQ